MFETTVIFILVAIMGVLGENVEFLLSSNPVQFWMMVGGCILGVVLMVMSMDLGIIEKKERRTSTN